MKTVKENENENLCREENRKNPELDIEKEKSIQKFS